MGKSPTSGLPGSTWTHCVAPDKSSNSPETPGGRSSFSGRHSGSIPRPSGSVIPCGCCQAACGTSLGPWALGPGKFHLLHSALGSLVGETSQSCCSGFGALKPVPDHRVILSVFLLAFPPCHFSLLSPSSAQLMSPKERLCARCPLFLFANKRPWDARSAKCGPDSRFPWRWLSW